MTLSKWIVGIGSADRRNFKELAVATTFKIARLSVFKVRVACQLLHLVID